MLRDSWKKKKRPKTNPKQTPWRRNSQRLGKFPLALQKDRSLENLSGEQEGRNQLLLSDSSSCRSPRSRGCVRERVSHCGQIELPRSPFPLKALPELCYR